MNSFAEIRTYEQRMARHIHDFSQIIVPLRGELDIEIEGAYTRLLPNATILISPGAVHEFESSQDSEFLIFDIAEDTAIDTFLSEKHSARRALTPAMWRYLQYVANEARLDDDKLLQSRALISTALDILTDAEDISEPLPKASPGLETAFDRLQKDFSNSLRIDIVAREAGYSVSNFQRRFRRVFDQTPKEVQINARMRRSVELLLTTEAAVSTIAFDLGYDNVSSFSNSFKRRYGVPPGTFRLQEK